MTTAIALYQTLAPDHAALAMRAEERIKARTVVTVIENGRDLLEVKNALGHGLFTEWLAQTFPFTERTAQRWMNAAEQYGAKSDLGSLLNSKVLQLLAAPSTPEDVREEIEARAAAGEKITVAEVERLKREARAAQAAAERLQAERSELLSRVDDATSREQQARDHLRLARERADAETRRAADAARAAVLAEAEQAKRNAEMAKAEAEAARAALENAVRQAREQAEDAAARKADALAEEALARRRSALAEIERHAKAAEEKAQRHHEAAQRLAAEIQQHHDTLGRLGSAEHEAPELIQAAERLMQALTEAMITLHGAEHAPLPPVARKWAMAQQMSGQMADAITAFLAPRVDAPANETSP
jgi:chromosome segregation ATPase